MGFEKDLPRLTAAEVLVRYNDGGYPDFCDPLTDVNQVGTFGNRPLHLASWQGNVEEIRALVEGGAEVNVVGDMGATPLHDAAQAGHPKAVKFLLECGAKPEAKDEFGRTPFDWADLNGHLEVGKLLSDANKSRRS